MQFCRKQYAKREIKSKTNFSDYILFSLLPTTFIKLVLLSFSPRNMPNLHNEILLLKVKIIQWIN